MRPLSTGLAAWVILAMLPLTAFAATRGSHTYWSRYFEAEQQTSGGTNQASFTPFVPSQGQSAGAGERRLVWPVPRAEEAGTLEERICERVRQRFADNALVLARVNLRLGSRYAFTCSASATGPTKSPVNAKVSTEPPKLTVTRSAGGYRDDAIAQGASHLPALTIDFTASCASDVTVERLTVKDRGVGGPEDVQGVWVRVPLPVLEEEATTPLRREQKSPTYFFRGQRGRRQAARQRIATAPRFRRASEVHDLNSQDKSVDVRLVPSLVVPACETVTADLMVDFVALPQVNTRHSLSIDRAEDISASVPVSGIFPLFGNPFEITSFPAGVITLRYLPVEEDAHISGNERQVVGAFELETDSTEDHTLLAIALENRGTARDGDFVGIFLRQSSGRGQYTNIAAQTDDDRVTLLFDPPYLLRSSSRLQFEIIADIVDESGRSVRMVIEHPSDVYAIGLESGYGAHDQFYGSHVVIEGNPTTVRIRE